MFPTKVSEAAPLVVTDPYAFSLACSLDRGTRAEIIWTIPYLIKQTLGHLEPEIIYKMSLEDLTDLFSKLKYKPRFLNDAPRTMKELTAIVVERFEGDAATIWEGKSASDVKQTFMSIHGVGNGIANMTVLLIEAAFGIRFPDFDRPSMDIKPDVQTMRVLYRIGVSDKRSENNAIEAARKLNPDFPGALDGVLWWIGRTWCFETTPLCSSCCINSVCQKRIV